MEKYAFVSNRVEEKRSESRNILNEDYNIKLSIDRFEKTYRFKLYNKSKKSISLLIDKSFDILSRIKVFDKLYMIYYPADTSYPRWYIGTTVRHITKYDRIKSKSRYLMGLELLKTKGSKRKEKVYFSLRDNGGRRLDTCRRKFSYDAHIPERRSGKEQRSGKDRRNETVNFSNKVNISEHERRIAFLS